jgi:hypothetical protein
MGRTLILAAVMTTAVAAQTPAPEQAPRINTGDLRHQIFVMEGALARAVQFGALQVNREMRSVSPELFSLAGDTSARGVYLDDYGVYFDVGVPILRPSMVWSFKQIYERDDRQTREAINELKRLATADIGRVPANRRALDMAIAQLEARLEPGMPGMTPGLGAPVAQQQGAVAPQQQGANVGAAMIPPDAAVAGGTPTPPPASPTAPTPDSRSVPGSMVLKDPNRAYTEAVQRALIDAMIDYSTPMRIAPHEWLTVAARDNAPRDLFAPPDPFDEIVTILFRIKGEDLAAYRAGKIDREEAKKRVQVREF